MEPEERYLQFGGDRPDGFGLSNATSAAGMDARAGLEYLITQIRRGGTVSMAARNILRSCSAPESAPLCWPDLMSLHTNYWRVTQPLLNYVWRTGGLEPSDFEDGGLEFRTLVWGTAVDGATRKSGLGRP